MEANYIPQRGIDFDDFIASIYLSNTYGLENVQFVPRLCLANDNHEDDFIGIFYSGYDTKKTGKLVQGIMFPTKTFTPDDLNRLFDKVETEEGIVYRPKSDLTLDEVYVRVCYSKTEGKADTIKWVSAVDGGELFSLHGEKRIYKAE